MLRRFLTKFKESFCFIRTGTGTFGNRVLSWGIEDDPAYGQGWSGVGGCYRMRMLFETIRDRYEGKPTTV
jgi:hypothetical protein